MKIGIAVLPVPIVLGLLYIFILIKCRINKDAVESVCWVNHATGKKLCRLRCAYGYFSLVGMETCEKWLSCEEIENNIEIVKMIGNGAVKAVYKGLWNNYSVAVNIPVTEKNLEDFKYGQYMVTILQPTPFIIQLVGYCKDDKYVTEYHPLKSADTALTQLSADSHSKNDIIKMRFQMCLNYVSILDFLHNSPTGTLVMCDSNSLEKTLNQYLVRSDFYLILNDLDALPKVEHDKGKYIKCGHRELGGDFVAPEQLWPFWDSEFNDTHMPPYDEKSDIWKIPAVCDYFLGSEPSVALLRLKLFNIYSKCKTEDPHSRPTAHEILTEYRKIWQEYIKHYQKRDL